MQGASAQGLLFVIGLALAGAGFIGIVFVANRLLAPRNPSAEKSEPFECGLDQAGDPHAPARMRFSTIAMLFVLFDAEAVLLFAVISALKGNLLAIGEVAAFTLFLAFGLLYAWKKGALQWRA